MKKYYKTIAMTFCLCMVAFTSKTMAQTEVQYTDASGVTCTYATFVEGGTTTYVRLKKLDNFPPTVSKWVLPENVTVNGIAYPLRYIADNAWAGNQLQSTALTEVVFPKFLNEVLPPFSQALENQRVFPNVRKITFGEQARWFHNAFNYLPLDSVIFLGTNTFVENKLMGTAEFAYSPTTTKIIVPCGTLSEFVTRFANSQWNNGNGMSASFWTSANFYEAECLNTLTVLSSNNSLGNAYSLSGGSYITTTPSNTVATFSGTATLLALPRGGKVFVGWSDGNLDNPRTVSVSTDAEYTAVFADCESTGLEAPQASPAAVSGYYNLQGARLTAPPASGVYIIQYDNGKTAKAVK
jgi:hypothetical protein